MPAPTRWTALPRARMSSEDLTEQGFLVGTKDYTIALGKCDRSGTIVEPRLSPVVRQDCAARQRAIEVVEKGYIRFTPGGITGRFI